MHAAAFTVLVTLTPLKNVIIPRPPTLEEAEQNRIERMQGEKVETAAEQIRELRLADMRLGVNDLKTIRDEINTIEKIKQEEFEKATGRKMEPPPPMDEGALTQLKAGAEAKQAELARLEDTARKAEEEAARLTEDAESKRQESSKAVSREQQLRDEIKRLRNEAQDKRKEANAWEGRQQAAEREARNSENERSRKQNQARQFKDQARRVAGEARGFEDEAGRLQAEAKTLREKETAARVESGEKKNNLATRQQAEQKEREANRLKGQVAQVESRVRQLASQAVDSRRRETGEMAKSDQCLEEAAASEKIASEKREMQKLAGNNRMDAEKEAGRLDQEAIKLEQEFQALRSRRSDLERQAGEGMQKARNKATEAEEAAESARGAEIQANNMSSRVRREQTLRSGKQEAAEDTSVKDIAGLYDYARSLEDQITESYRNIRAAELAMIRNLDYRDAVKMTDVANPPRPELDRQALGMKIGNGRDFVKYEKELTKASQELNDMLGLATSMRGASQGLTEDGKDGMNISGELAKEMTGALGKLEGQAGASKGRGDIKDMSGLMENAYETASALAARTSTGGNKPGQGERAGGGQAGADRKTGGAQGAGKAEDQAGAQGVVKGRTTSEPWRLVRKEGGDGAPRLYESSDDYQLARSIAKDGDPADWLFLDSWYVMGPFPNPQRKNINKLFPPETVVDLDASYEGMNGQMVRWIFMQTGSPFIEPPRQKDYAIYYFYTELFSDEARDIWLLIGSDDQTKLWINGQLVWKSADILKSWSIDEGYRKVRLVKGVNKVLMRLENGWYVCGASLGFSLRPPR